MDIKFSITLLSFLHGLTIILLTLTNMELHHKPNMNPQSLSSRQTFKNIRTKATWFQQKHLSSYTRKPNSNKPDTLMQKLVWTEVH